MSNTIIQRVIEQIGHITTIGNALLQHLLQPNDKAVLKALEQYQNDDGGFGHGLEPDIQMPLSNIASTDVAISILEQIDDCESKTTMIKRIVTYLEDMYQADTLSFPFVPKEIDQYPHAVWWNSDTLDAFTYGNPHPELLGFLLQYKEYVQRIDVETFKKKVINYIKGPMEEEVSMHSVLSLCRLYFRAPESVKSELHDYVLKYVHQCMETNPDNWTEYSLEPYKVYLIVPDLFHKTDVYLEQNIQKYEQLLEETIIEPNWNWYQYPEEFENAKQQWIPFIQYDILRAIQLWRKQ